MLHKQGQYTSVIGQLEGYNDEDLSSKRQRRTLHYLLAMAHYNSDSGDIEAAIAHAQAFMDTHPSKKDSRFEQMLELSKKQIMVITENTVGLTDPFTDIFPEPATTTALEEPTQVFQIVEEMPQPEGGITAFLKNLQSNMQYPEEAKKNKVSGTVFVSFIVLSNGSLTELEIAKGVGQGLDEEAIRLIKTCKWIAGRQGGKNVNVRVMYPVRFVLP